MSVPAKLQQAVGKKVIRVPLGLTLSDDPTTIEREALERYSQYKSWFKLLSAENADVLSDVERHQAAQAYLANNSLKAGDLVKPEMLASEETQYEHYKEHILDTHFPDYAEAYKENAEPQLRESLKVQELAWKLLQEPQFGSVRLHRFNLAWEFHCKNQKLDRAVRADRKTLQFWDRFIAVVGDQPITAESVYEAQRQYVEHELARGLAPQSIERALVSPKTALRSYIDEYQLDVAFKSYKIKQAKQVREREGITERDQIKIYDIAISGKTAQGEVVRDDVRICLLLLCQTSINNSEIQRLLVDDVIFDGHRDFEGIPYLAIRNQTKSGDRKRPIPLVVGVDLLQELIEKVAEEGYALGKMATQSESTISYQVNRVLKEINPNITTYSCRHGWLDRAFAADCGESFLDRVGGWSGGVKSKKRGYARLADTSYDRLKAYLSGQQRLNTKLMNHGSKESNVVPLAAV